MKKASVFFLLSILLFVSCHGMKDNADAVVTRPNFLLILTDDQSWAHTGVEGYPLVQTPNFDAMARQGIYFRNGYVSAPSCTASRSAILSGQDFWRTGTGAVLMGAYPPTLISYQEILSQHGYRTAYTGKGWGPGNQYDRALLVGEQFNNLLKQNIPEGISPTDYSANFDVFLNSLEPGVPFSFWMGIQEPHRRPTQFSAEGYAENSGNYFATPAQQRWLPEFLPNTDFVHKDFQGYLQQIEQMDGELKRIFKVLKKHHQLDNTIIVFASDNGMPYPGAKTNNSLYGVRVPFVVQWASQTKHDMNNEYMISTIDIAPTFLEAAGVPVPTEMTGVSFLPLLKGEKKVSSRAGYVVTGFERHAPNARANHASYPSRAVITHDYMYVHNYLPELWPFGDPPLYGDGQSYVLWKDVKDLADVEKRKAWLLGKRPAEMLFDIDRDPFQKRNLIATAEGLQQYAVILDDARKKLQVYQEKTQDPILKDLHYFQAMPFVGQ